MCLSRYSNSTRLVEARDYICIVAPQLVVRFGEKFRLLSYCTCGLSCAHGDFFFTSKCFNWYCTEVLSAKLVSVRNCAWIKVQKLNYGWEESLHASHPIELPFPFTVNPTHYFTLYLHTPIQTPVNALTLQVKKVNNVGLK